MRRHSQQDKMPNDYSAETKQNKQDSGEGVEGYGGRRWGVGGKRSEKEEESSSKDFIHTVLCAFGNLAGREIEGEEREKEQERGREGERERGRREKERTK